MHMLVSQPIIVQPERWFCFIVNGLDELAFRTEDTMDITIFMNAEKQATHQRLRKVFVPKEEKLFLCSRA